ncbi:acyl-CoA dehydrogenase family protein [Brevibacterium daeguense]|uniref:Acyl-CoA dehydrogenase family protein n=1 Tax=Brevibacterium daeguense TaxID=909936 RepID=A0ABP8EIF0_9MICO|nr:acyl-CoA dehydrogenase family protein [Brevibacterium daeguense]
MTDRETRHAELARQYLPDELLERVRGRAGDYDRENRFFAEDLEELRERGYLTLFAPEEFGGPGLSVNQVSRLQQRLAAAAPATALGINMHLVCTGAIRAMYERGERSLNWVFEEIMAGELFAFGISEAGNDWVLQSSNSTAEPQDDGGYRITGKKIFTSLSPAWTRLLVHGLDSSDPDNPMVVYGFLERGEDGISISENWDVMGMRATHSRSTTLENVRMRPERVARRIPDGPNPDPLTFGITANFQLLIASVYTGLATRALDVAAEALTAKQSAKHGSSYAEIPQYRDRLADAAMDLMPVPAQLEAYSRDFDELVDHGKGWPRRLVTARINAGEAARRSVEAALRCAGGAGYSNGHELGRLYRDALAGMFHPAGIDAARPMFAAALLDD